MPWKFVYRDRYLVGSNWKKGRCSIKLLRGHTDGITCLQLAEMSRILITGSYDATVKVWNIDTGEEMRTLHGHTRGIRALCIDKFKVFSGGLDGTIRLWSWRTGEAVTVLNNHSGVVSLDFQRDVLVSGGTDGIIRSKSERHPQQTETETERHIDKMLTLSVKPVWTFPKEGERQMFSAHGHTDWVNQVRLDLNSRTILSGSDGEMSLIFSHISYMPL
jgi:F-box/WD-40 domain protein MET30